MNATLLQTLNKEDFHSGTRDLHKIFHRRNEFQNMFSQNVYNGASISVSQKNGEPEIEINGQPIDLVNAIVLEDGQNKLLEPTEMHGARITVNKTTGQITVDYQGAHYRSMSPDMITAPINPVTG